jgi:hypothetical protein
MGVAPSFAQGAATSVRNGADREAEEEEKEEPRALGGKRGQVGQWGGEEEEEQEEEEEAAAAAEGESGMSEAPLSLVTGVSKDFYDRLQNLVGSVHAAEPDMPIVVYDMGLTREQVGSGFRV